MSSKQMKSFYRQKKKSSDSSSSSKKPQSASAAIGSDTALPHPKVQPIVVRYDDKEEEALRQFDMNMAFGPCLGMSRLDRWERASRLRLNPPQQVRHLLDLDSTDPRSHCLWAGRI